YFTVFTGFPSVTIASPQNLTYNVSAIDLNYTPSGSNLDSCWYSLDGGSNTSLPGCNNGSLGSLTTGAHNVTVYVNNTVGNTNSSIQYFTVDLVYPGISILLPTNSTYSSGTVPLNFTYSDNFGISACWYYVDGAGPTYSCSNTTMPGLLDGGHNVSVYVNDTAGNVNGTIQYFTVFTGFPSVTIASPQNLTYNVSSISLDFTVFGSGVDSCWYYLDGAGPTPLPGCANSTLSSLTTGPHNVTVSVNNSAGNTASDEIIFTVDLIPPAVSLDSPQNTTYNVSFVDLNFTASDNLGIGSCWYFLDGTGPTILPGCANDTIGPLLLGPHNITLFINDTAGNQNSSEIIFTINSTFVPPEEDDDDEEKQPLSVSAVSTCDGTIITVESGGDPVRNAEVKVDGNLLGKTNKSGQIALDDCGKEVIIRASKSGYSSDHVHLQLIDCLECQAYPACQDDYSCPPTENCIAGTCTPIECECGVIQLYQCVKYECCSDSQCGQDESCINQTCQPVIPQFECTSDEDCSSTQYCEKEPEAIGGSCSDVQGCGSVVDHLLLPYECGTGSGCPSCDEGSFCSGNQCVAAGLECPPSAFIDDVLVCNATIDGKPCIECVFDIIDPTGVKSSGSTDAEGKLRFLPRVPGVYHISLLERGLPVKGVAFNATQKPPAPPAGPDMTLICGISLILLFIGGLLLWKLRKKKEKQKIPPLKS
ncbi:MAG: hypothetical protein V1827_00595, partial [Candidatus Micrarchaeota archaeon]